MQNLLLASSHAEHDMEIIPPTLEPYALAGVTTLQPTCRKKQNLSNVRDRTYRTEMIWLSKLWLLVIVCPIHDFITIFVQNRYFGSKQRLRDQHIRASIFQSCSYPFCEKTTEVFAATTARNDCQATPKQYFHVFSATKWGQVENQEQQRAAVEGACRNDVRARIKTNPSINIWWRNVICTYE